jgi:hypothetical protein
MFFRRLISGIAGRDIRKGIEIFLDFCKSAYVDSGEMFKIRRAMGKYKLPSHVITRVLLRGSRRYYRDENSFIKNVFTSSPEDEMPDPFNRIAILRWLRARYRIFGPNNIMGYHKISELLSHLVCDGHSEERIRSEILKLLQSGCVITESQIIDSIEDNELICITPTGHVHLDLLCNIDYLASCAEDVWYMNQQTAERIADRMSGKIGIPLSPKTTYENAADLVKYLNEYKLYLPAKPEAYLVPEFEKLSDISELNETIKKRYQIYTKYNRLRKKYPIGKHVNGQVIVNTSKGVIIEFEFDKGIVLRDDKSFNLVKDCERGEWLDVTIKKVSYYGNIYLTIDENCRRNI